LVSGTDVVLATGYGSNNKEDTLDC